MKSLFFRRLCAYIFDFVIVTFIVSIVTYGFKNNNDIVNQMNELLSRVTNNEVTIEEYSEQMFKLNYEYQKSVIPTTIVSITISMGYFIIFACLNKGNTLGKRIFKLKVVNKEGKLPNIWNMIGRSIFLYGILIGIINIICLYLLDAEKFNYVSGISNYIYYGFIIICILMVMYRKDNRGLHDIIGGTNVIGEVK